VVAGVVTLMLEANPELGWRDVQEILLRSSSKLLPKSKGWVERVGGLPMMPKIKHHHGFGGGKIDAVAAVVLAESWVNLPAETMVESSFFKETEKFISDKGVPEVVAFDFHGGSPMRVEFVELELDLPHSRRGDLLIKVRSPSGVESVMAAPSRGGRGYDAATGYLGQGYEGWTFMSVRHWGETSEGVWQLLIRDMRRGDQGYVRSAKLRLFGTSTDAGMMADESSANRRSTVHAADSNSGMGPVARAH
jgi:subtilisin-like proprotein convertase family protein